MNKKICDIIHNEKGTPEEVAKWRNALTLCQEKTQAYYFNQNKAKIH